MATLSQLRYLKAFAATTLLATGGFMLMPFGSAFSVNNLGLTLEQLPFLYMITGICAMATGPFIGMLSDSWGKFNVFVAGSVLTMITVVVYCNLGITPLWTVIIISALMFIGVSSRIISSQALISAVPEPKDRGAFMGINSSVQYVSGAIASFIAGLIVVETSSGKLVRYDVLGYVVVTAMLITVTMIYFLDRSIKRRLQTDPSSVQPNVTARV